MALKQKIRFHCLQLLNDKIQELENTLKGLGESAANDTKSSAGDKHETGRAMIHIEQETITKQLNDALEQKASLEKTEGRLIKTNRGYVFLAVPIGKIIVEGTTVMAISPGSPLGMKLAVLKVNESAEINGVNYFVER